MLLAQVGPLKPATHWHENDVSDVMHTPPFRQFTSPQGFGGTPPVATPPVAAPPTATVPPTPAVVAPPTAADIPPTPTFDVPPTVGDEPPSDVAPVPVPAAAPVPPLLTVPPPTVAVCPAKFEPPVAVLGPVVFVDLEPPVEEAPATPTSGAMLLVVVLDEQAIADVSSATVNGSAIRMTV